jgi:hypothetical protein
MTMRLRVWSVLRRDATGRVAQSEVSVSGRLRVAGGGGGLFQAEVGAWLHSLLRAMIGVRPGGELAQRHERYYWIVT